MTTDAYTPEESTKLSNDHKVILFSVNAGLKYKEISAQLNIPLGTVRSRLNRARAALAQIRSNGND